MTRTTNGSEGKISYLDTVFNLREIQKACLHESDSESPDFCRICYKYLGSNEMVVYPYD